MFIIPTRHSLSPRGLWIQTANQPGSPDCFPTFWPCRDIPRMPPAGGTICPPWPRPTPWQHLVTEIPTTVGFLMCSHCLGCQNCRGASGNQQQLVNLLACISQLHVNRSSWSFQLLVWPLDKAWRRFRNQLVVGGVCFFLNIGFYIWNLKKQHCELSQNYIAFLATFPWSVFTKQKQYLLCCIFSIV